MKKLNQKQINSKLSKFSGWTFENKSISKQFQFKDFIEASSFVTAIGMEAEKMNHHPDILMFEWNKVKITVSTHDAGGVTVKDFSLAQKIEERKK
ncbi:MAG: 4a-hydroxytetrahydrobiopterin dehydratase [Ignavibacterium sp.]|nr:4a-hydroxytetrahydrobiopterin dehydratase [Ignavibacterium sp.]